MTILFPQAIVHEMRAFIQELSEMYQDDGKMRIHLPIRALVMIDDNR